MSPNIADTLREVTADNASFSKKTPGLQLAWDSTSLGKLKLCPRLYFYNIIMGYEPKGEAPQLAFGIAFHKCIEHYVKRCVEGAARSEAMRSSVRLALQITGERVEELRCIACETKATAVAPDHICHVCGSDEFQNKTIFKPWPWGGPSDPKQKPRSRYALVRAVVWYIDKYIYDPAKTLQLADGRPAAELSFRFHIGSQSFEGEDFMYCGHIDWCAEFNGLNLVIDHKTTTGSLGSYFFEKFTPDNQMSGYDVGASIALATDMDGVMVNAVQLGVNFARFERAILKKRTQGLREEWLHDVNCWLKKAQEYADDQYWPHNDMACGLYGGCAFRSVCSSDPNIRKIHLESDFKRREKTWDPMETR